MLTLALIVFPLLMAMAVIVLGPRQARALTLAATAVELVLALLAVVRYKSGLTGLLQFNEPWMASMGLNFHFALDGISLVLLLLTVITAPLIVYATGNRPIQNAHVFYALILLMLGAMIGCFAAADGLMFYAFYEISLIPIFFIAHIWGNAENKAAVTIKFFLYTLFGSLFMLVSLIYVYQQTSPHSFDLDALYAAGRAMTVTEQGLVFFGIFIAFAVKMPVFPFHTWQPATYQMSPTAGTMLLAAVMLKMATYGIIRLILPMVPAGVEEYGNVAITLSVISIIYASCLAIVQKRYKLLIAYSSIAHVGIISAGVLTGSEMGIQGGLIEMFSHGILAVGLFYAYDILTSRLHSDEMATMGGIRGENPLFAFLFFIIVMGSVALPFTSGFVGEFLLLAALFQGHEITAAVAGLSVILGAVYMLRAFQKMFLGESNSRTAGFAPLTVQEKSVLIAVVALVIFIGIYPKPLLDLSAQAVTELLSK